MSLYVTFNGSLGNDAEVKTSAKGNPQVKAAMDQVSALEELLDKEVLPLLSK